MRHIFLIDCPGVVYPTGDTQAEIVLKGVIRMENLKDPEFYIEHILQRVKPGLCLCRIGSMGFSSDSNPERQIAMSKILMNMQREAQKMWRPIFFLRGLACGGWRIGRHPLEM